MKFHLRSLSGWLVLLLASSCLCETYLFTPATSARRLKVVRTYKIITSPTRTNVVELPAAISFTGATNEQTIESSQFTFSVKPDKIDVIEHDFAIPRKMYRMEWQNPPGVGVTVTQEMRLLMKARNRLFTAAKLPYSSEVLDAQKSCLGKGNKGGINPDNPALEPVCAAIRNKSQYAEEVIAGVCDWIVENIELKRDSYGSDKTFQLRKGNDYGMTYLACSMLRHMGIPSDRVYCQYIDGSSGFYIIEAYLPDTGWVFYDVAWPERGFKSLYAMITMGWCYCVLNDKEKREWIQGEFCEEWDVGRYREPEPVYDKMVCKTPKDKEALSVEVIHSAPSAKIPVRHKSLRDLLLDKNYPPPEVVEKKADEKGRQPSEQLIPIQKKNDKK